jgi:hypothetical protein
MNRLELLALAIGVAFCVLGYFVSGAVAERLGPHVRRWLQPLAGQWSLSAGLKSWLFERIEAAELPQNVRQFFETHTAAFVGRGFQPLGDFLLLRGSPPSCIRYFLSPDGTVIGELNHYQGTPTIGCMSVLLDGHYLESGTIPIDELPPAEHGLEFFILNTDDARELIDHHVSSVAKTAAARGTQTAQLKPSDVQSVANYGRKLSLHSLHQQGVLDELPEFLRDPASGCGSGA